MRILLSSLLTCFFLAGFAQDVKTVRIEIPADVQADSYRLEPIGENGVLIFYASNEVDKEGKRNWYFGLFDNMLNQQWLKFVSLNDHVAFVKSRINGKRTHLLFRSTGKTKEDYDFYEIVTYDAKNETFALISGSIPEKVEIVGFEVINNTACLALNLRKNTSDLVFINLITGEVSPVHLAEGDQSNIGQIGVDSPNERFIVATKVVNNGRYLNDVIKFYSPKGSLLTEYTIKNPESTKMLRSFVFFPKKGGDLVVLGSYDIISGRMASLKDLDKTDEAKGAGYYFLKFEGNEQQTLNYFDFLTFSNINGTMEAREIVNKRMYNDSTGTKEKNKVVTAFFNLTQPSALMMGDNYVISTEVYKPYYRTETRMDYDYYGRPYPNTYSVFAGYQYYDILVASFSNNGEMLWDNELKISNLLTYKLTRNSIMVVDSPWLTMGYVNDGKIFSKTMEGGITISTDDSPVAPFFNRDRIAQDEDNFILHWYGQYYLIYGEEIIRNRALSEQDSRTVFYVNKVAFQ